MDKIKLYQENIINNFYNNYFDFLQENPLNISEDNDITLDFISCTICRAKDNIRNNKIGENYIMLQSCLRNNVFETLENKNIPQTYMSYFHMLGGFCYFRDQNNYTNELNNIVCRQFQFLNSTFKGKNIKLTIPKQYLSYILLNKETIDYLYSHGCIINYSVDDEKNLSWKYGINGVKGFGTRWEVINEKGIYVNCGNDILVFNGSNAFGIDFGGGLEALTSVYTGNNNLLYSSTIYNETIKNFVNDNDLNTKFISAMTAMLVCFYLKNKKNIRVNYVIDKYIRIISAIAIYNEISDLTIYSIFFELCKQLNVVDDFNNNQCINKIFEQMKFLKKISVNYDDMKKFDKYIVLNYTNLLDIEKHSIKRLKKGL